jgi:serine/threonine-protein kinase
MIGAYRLLEEIGAGGMSTIYRGEQAALDRPVAIKELRAPLAADEEMAQRFEREAKASAALSHQNIVQIFDFIRKGGNAYIVMEYVDGVDLARVLRETGRLPLHLALPIAHQVCLALEHAHRRGLVHRDVKPSNVMISTEGRVKLMDFGIAHKRAETLTQPGSFLGTPAYMSPEQVMGGPVGPTSDVFSFGIVLYELLSGTRPFVEDASGSVGQKIAEGRYVDPRRAAPAMPRGVARVIRTSLATKPDRRYADATALRLALEALLSKRDLTGAREAMVRYLAERGIFDARAAIEQLPRAPLAPRVWRAAATAAKLAATSVVAAQWLTSATLGVAGPVGLDTRGARAALPAPRALAVRAAPAHATVVGPAGHRLWIDGRPAGPVVELPAGRHVVDLRPAGAEGTAPPAEAPEAPAARPAGDAPDVTTDAR